MAEMFYKWIVQNVKWSGSENITALEISIDYIWLDLHKGTHRKLPILTFLSFIWLLIPTYSQSTRYNNIGYSSPYILSSLSSFYLSLLFSVDFLPYRPHKTPLLKRSLLKCWRHFLCCIFLRNDSRYTVFSHWQFFLSSLDGSSLIYNQPYIETPACVIGGVLSRHIRLRKKRRFLNEK